MKLESLPVEPDPFFCRDFFVDGPVAVSPGPHHIETLQRHSRRVQAGMARRAARIGPVSFDLLPDGDGAADIRFDRWNGRRRRRLEAQDPFRDPHAAQHRRGRCAVGRDLEHAGLRHESAADALLVERDLPHLGPRDPLDAVVPGQPLVEKREIGIDDVPRRQILFQEFRDEEPRFLHGSQLQRVVQLVVVVKRRGGGVVVDLTEVEPIVGKGLDETPRFGIVEHPLGLGSQHSRVAQCAPFGQFSQPCVGGRIPEEQRQSCGQLSSGSVFPAFPRRIRNRATTRRRYTPRSATLRSQSPGHIASGTGPDRAQSRTPWAGDGRLASETRAASARHPGPDFRSLLPRWWDAVLRSRRGRTQPAGPPRPRWPGAWPPAPLSAAHSASAAQPAATASLGRHRRKRNARRAVGGDLQGQLAKEQLVSRVVSLFRGLLGSGPSTSIHWIA